MFAGMRLAAQRGAWSPPAGGVCVVESPVASAPAPVVSRGGAPPEAHAALFGHYADDAGDGSEEALHGTLLPAYRAAVDAHDAAGALALAAALAAGVRRLRQPATAEVQAAIADAPQVVGMLATVDRVRSLLGRREDTCEPASREDLAAAASEITAWRGRPASWRFLVAALREEGLWDPVAGALARVDATVDANARAFGERADVGTYDEARVDALLPVEAAELEVPGHGVVTRGTSRAAADEVFAMIASAAPDARGALVKRLAASDRLARLCGALPWTQVAALMEQVGGDREARALLAREIEGKGGGQSVTSMIEGRIIDNLREEAPAAAYAWQVLLTAYHGLTFGFGAGHDAAYDAREAGLISEDEYASAVSRQALKSGALALATTLSGGAAGTWSAGAARALGAGKGLQAIIGGTVGGGAAGVAGRGVEDAFAGELSDLEAYRDAGLLGAVMGGVTAAVPVAGSRYLPASAKTIAQVYAERHPRLEGLFRRWHQAGLQSGRELRVSVDELRALVAEGLVAPEQAELALAGASAEARGVLVRRPVAPDEPFTVRRFADDDVAAHHAEETRGPAASRADHVTREDVADADVYPTSARGAGAISDLEHHVMPQEHRAWFERHGIDIDDYCVKLAEAEHQALHGGGNYRRGRAWEGEWNRMIMSTLRNSEQLMVQTVGRPLSRAEVIQIVEGLMQRSGLSTDYVRYSRASRKAEVRAR